MAGRPILHQSLPPAHPDPLLPPAACSARASSFSRGTSQQTEALSNSIADAVNTVCSGSGEVSAVSDGAADATAEAVAEAYVETFASVQASPNCKGCAGAEGTATAVARAFAEAVVGALTQATDECCPDGPVTAGAKDSLSVSAFANAFKEAIAAGKCWGWISYLTLSLQ